MSRLSRSLSAKLTLWVVIVAVTIFLITAGIMFMQSRYMLRKEAKERANSVLNSTLEHVRNQMSVVETAVNTNVWLAEENFQPDSLLGLVRRIVYLNRNTYGCTIAAKPDAFANYGRYFSVFARLDGDTVVVEREPEYEYCDEDWYKVPIDSAKGCWVDLYREDTKGLVDLDRSLAIYSRPFYKDGQAAGVVSTGLSFRRLAELLYSVDYPYPNAYFVILGGDGRYLLHPDTARLFKKTVFSDQNLGDNSEVIALGHEMLAGHDGVAHLKINGRNYHVCYCPIPETDWSLALICPTSDVLKGYNHMALLVLIVDILGVLLIVVMARWGVRRSLAPLGRLLVMSKHMAEGKYNETIPHTRRKDAVGQLQNNFATMQHSVRDHVSSIRQTTDEITRHNKELVYATELAEEALRRKNVFLQNVMHQIRTPLNIIQGFAQVLRDESNDTIADEEFVGIATTMKHNSQHLNRMVLMLYDSSAINSAEGLKIERTDQVSCNEVVRESIEFVNEHFPDIPIKFTTELSDSVMILTNHLYLMRTVRELLYNAAKFSDGQHISISVTQNEHWVVYTVEDTGPGLPHGEQDMIYEFFTKLDDLSEGLGLGLPLSKRHAISIGGNMVYDTKYKDGARFVVTMPK